MNAHVDRPWNTAFGGLGGKTTQLTLVNKLYNPPKLTYSDVFTSFGVRTRGAIRKPPMINGWRYASAYTARIVRVGLSGPSEWWDSASFQNFTYPSWSVTPGWVDDIDLTKEAYASASDKCAAAADTRALASLSQERVQLSTALLESRKTIDHLAHTFLRVFGIYRSLRKGRFGDVAEELGLSLTRRATRNLASNWLEYKYAWLPLYSDLHALLGIAQKGLDTPLTMKVVSDIKTSLPATVKSYRWQYYDATRVRGTTVATTKDVRVGCKTIIHARVDSNQLQQLKQLGMVNPFQIAWELVPYSFVVDWILPVGTFLEACSGPLGLTFMDGSRTRYLSGTFSVPECGTSAITQAARVHTEPEVSWDILQMSRSALANWPIPKLYTTNHLATEKVFTASALWRQRQR